MFGYWLLFAFPAAAAMLPSGRIQRSNALVWWLFGSVLVLAIGYRYQVGGDWMPYMLALRRASTLGFTDAVQLADPAYQVLNWLSLNLGWGIFGVNLVCGAIFVAGLVAFCRAQPYPWLGVAVAMPYLVTVVAMGYTRQATAIGLLLFAIERMESHHRVQAFLLAGLAALFHFSAILWLPLLGIATSRGRLLYLLIGVSAAAVIYQLFATTAVDKFVTGYLVNPYQSSGAWPRILMNAIPAALFLMFPKRFEVRPSSRQLWMCVAAAAILCIPLLALNASRSTAIDRVALYFTPIQVFVLSRVPSLFTGEHEKVFVRLATVLLAAAVLLTWLLFAQTAFAWLPYRFYPFEIVTG